MTRLGWDLTSEKIYEYGSDRGVLYPPGEDGVPWNGLVSVQESSSGGDLTEYHFDGKKYLGLIGNMDYQGTLEAFTYPNAFEKCLGSQSIEVGFLATRQPSTPFGLSYRTKIGNDVDGVEHAYKIHLVYNALATPSSKSHVTAAEQVDISNFSWGITATPIRVPGFKPTAHFIIDSRYTNPFLMEALEDILYGDIDGDSRLPTPAEIADLYNNAGATIAIVDHGDGTWSATGPDELITMLDGETFQITDVDATYLDADTYEVSTTD